MKLLFLFSFFTVQIFARQKSGETPDQNKAETSVKKFMSSKNKNYLPIDFGECFSSESFAKELQEKTKNKSKAMYTIPHTYSIDGVEIKDMWFHLDGAYNVIGKNTHEEITTLVTDDSRGDRENPKKTLPEQPTHFIPQKLPAKTKLHYGSYIGSFNYNICGIDVKKNGSCRRYEMPSNSNIFLAEFNGKWTRSGDTLIVSSEKKEYVPVGGFNPKYLIRADTLILLETKENGTIVHKDTLLREKK